ncbi:unnamed protein product [Rhizoctonia solani]|uniref:T6SS Phospholipase effector Tle1-like catalytic domain-containing protein n=1 Tax=Rhizoctonia solani TaxID=456999 RepID=A0A8H3AA65_9AGAM|nr:unnamed protein product [Rhizoctonia solani]
MGTILNSKTRNLVVCVDGTSNKFSDKNTNVVELYECLKKDDLQKTFYSSGIGTFAKPSWGWAASLKERRISLLDLAVAKNLKKVILDAYRWLADTYQSGDRIFLFGFSRGAYQVRALAAMIECVGLIHAGNLQQIPFAWDLYSTLTSDTQCYLQKLTHFKDTFSRSVRVYFLGAWDTVSSVGFIRDGLLPLAMKNRHIEHFRHALALDECRVKFLPEYAADISGGTNTSKNVWFAGTHSDIGGKNTRNAAKRGAEPLYWMMDEAKQLGLRLRRQDISACLLPGTPRNSVGFWWLPLEYFPIRRASPKPDNMSHHSRLPHCSKGRRIVSPTHKLHWSVIANAQQGNYEPQAVFKLDKDTTLTLGEMIKQGESTVKEYCDAGYDNIRVLQLIKCILQAPGKATEDESLDSLLKELLELAYSGQTKIIWIYGGPDLLLNLMAVSRGTGDAADSKPRAQYCESIIYAVMDPIYHIRWEEHLGMFAEGKKLTYNLIDEINEVVLPRLHHLLQKCQSILEPSKVRAKCASNHWSISSLKRLAKSSKNEHTISPPYSYTSGTYDPSFYTLSRLSNMLNIRKPTAAVHLSSIVLTKISELLKHHSENLDPESTFIKDISLLLLPPPKSNPDLNNLVTVPDVTNRMTVTAVTPQLTPEQRKVVVDHVIDIIIQITNLPDEHCWRKLCGGDVVKRLLPWFKHWGPKEVTSEAIHIINKFASDSKIAAYLVHEQFVEYMFDCYTNCYDRNSNMDGGDKEKSKAALAVLAKLTNIEEDAFNESTLLGALTTDTIAFLFNSMKTNLDLGTNSTDAITTLINLARFGKIRKMLIQEEIVPEIQQLLYSLCNESGPNSPNVVPSSFTLSQIDDTAKPGNPAQQCGKESCHEFEPVDDASSIYIIDIPSEVIEDKARVCIRLIAELARHSDAREKLLQKKRDICNALARLLKEESSKRACGEQLGPIAEYFFQALPVFVLFPKLRDPELAATAEKLVTGINGCEDEHNYIPKIAKALRYALGDATGEADHQPESNYRPTVMGPIMGEPTEETNLSIIRKNQLSQLILKDRAYAIPLAPYNPTGHCAPHIPVSMKDLDRYSNAYMQMPLATLMPSDSTEAISRGQHSPEGHAHTMNDTNMAIGVANLMYLSRARAECTNSRLPIGAIDRSAIAQLLHAIARTAVRF